jgi:Protein of unknown function (DUF2971)
LSASKRSPRPTLTKFFGPSDYSLANFDRGVLFCQHYSAYNDPFEFWTNLLSGIPDVVEQPERFRAALRAWGFGSAAQAKELFEQDFVNGAREYFEECALYAPPFEDMCDSFRLTCFTKDSGQLLMWSHYADGLRGFAVVFDEKELIFGRDDSLFLDVSYRSTPPEVDTLVYGVLWDQEDFHSKAIEEERAILKHRGQKGRLPANPDYKAVADDALKRMRQTWQLVFATKPKEWQYERERRLLIHSGKTDNSPIFLEYPVAAVREVILGERMEAGFRDRLLEVVRLKFPHASVRTARRSQNVYSLKIE